MIVVTACTAATDSTTTTQPDALEATSLTVASTTTSTLAHSTTFISTPPTFEATTSEVSRERLAHSWTEDCPSELDDLVLVMLKHWNASGEITDGAIVVARSHADSVIAIFHSLFEIGYPVASVIPIGDLPEGIEDTDPDYNNTSGLHCRFVQGTTNWSEHARGLAIDMNPLWNPYITSRSLWPPGDERYRDRTLNEPGMIIADDAVVRLFEDNGWFWGGYWNSVKDYHHFAVNNR